MSTANILTKALPRTNFDSLQGWSLINLVEGAKEKKLNSFHKKERGKKIIL